VKVKNQHSTLFKIRQQKINEFKTHYNKFYHLTAQHPPLGLLSGGFYYIYYYEKNISNLNPIFHFACDGSNRKNSESSKEN
jgi:hypothetical protein